MCYKKKIQKSLFFLICWNKLNTSVIKQSVLHILYVTYVIVFFIYRIVTFTDN